MYGQNTCEPDSTATKTSTLAKHLSSLSSGHMMSLIRHIRRPRRQLQHTPIQTLWEQHAALRDLTFDFHYCFNFHFCYKHLYRNFIFNFVSALNNLQFLYPVPLWNHLPFPSHFSFKHFITALHAMQTRSSDENFVCPSVRLSIIIIIIIIIIITWFISRQFLESSQRRWRR